MGLDLTLKHKPCPLCGHSSSEYDYQYTYNVAPMWYAIYPNAQGMVDVENLPNDERIERLKHAVHIMQRDKKKMIALNPPNGHGDYHGFLDFLTALLYKAQLYPDLVWTSWR